MEEQEKKVSASPQRTGTGPEIAPNHLDNGLCKECNEENRAAEANPYGTGPRRK